MRGHQPLIDLRLRGWQPSAVYVADAGLDGIGCWRDWPRLATDPHVELSTTDKPKRIDVRWAYGLTVHLDTLDAGRMRDLAAAFLAAGAARVFAAVREVAGEVVREVAFEVFEPVANVEL